MRALTITFALFTLTVRAALVYDTAAEFLTAGDFNGDGRQDGLVLDKISGNARVGYQNVTGALDWAQGVPTSADAATALAVGRFAQTNRDAIAVTAAGLNRVHIVNLSTPGSAPAPVSINPPHPDVSLLVALDAPLGSTDSRSWLSTGGHDPGITMLDLLAFVADSTISFQDQIAAEGFVSSGSSFKRFASDSTLLAAVRRGSNDAFVVYSYTNTTAPVLTRSNLPPGSEYISGRFNSEAYPRLLFYVPGGSNITVQSLVFSGGDFQLGPAVVNPFSKPVERIFFVEELNNGLVVVHFGDGSVQGLRPSTGSGQLSVAPGFAVGPSGNSIRGVIPLGVGKMAVLWASSNSLFSTQSQVLTRDANGNYVQTSSSVLPPVTSATTRGNVWLFQTEPFTSAAATLIASLSAPVWSSGVTGLPGAVSVRVETDRGVTNGLGSAVTNNFGAPPAGTVFALPNQYREDISFFGYAPARAPEPSVVTILPSPGAYAAPLQISFLTQDNWDDVYYRTAPEDWWQFYFGPFTVTNDTTVEYYGQNLSGARSRVQVAGYSLGRTNPPATDPAIVPDPTGTNQPPPVLPGTVLSGNGTIFYSRTDYTIWAIDMDGSGDAFVTSGYNPRVSRDGRYLLFLRPAEGLWLREMKTGAESQLDAQHYGIVSYDWEANGVSFVMDKDCYLWSRDLAGNANPFPLGDCSDDAPVVSPLDGSIAYHNQGNNTQARGIYVMPPTRATRTRLNLNLTSAQWPSWSPSGQRLAAAGGNPAAPQEVLGNLWLFNADGGNLRQITALKGNDGLPYGAVWAPDERALVTAGTIWGTNGLWILRLTADGNYCGCAPIRLPTTPGASIQIAGSIAIAPAPVQSEIQPGFFIHRAGDEIVVYWGTIFSEFHLEYSSSLSPAGAWTRIDGPYDTDGYFFYHTEPLQNLPERRFYRLAKP